MCPEREKLTSQKGGNETSSNSNTNNKVSRRTFLKIAGLFLGGLASGLTIDYWLLREQLENPEEDFRLRMAREIVAETKFRASGGLQDTTTAVNRLLLPGQEISPSEFELVPKGNGWCRLKNPEKWWPNFWNWEIAVPFRLFTSNLKNELNLEDPFFRVPYVFASEELVERIGGKDSLYDLTRAPVRYDPKSGKYKIWCGGGIFPQEGKFFYPWTTVGIKNPIEALDGLRGGGIEKLKLRWWEEGVIEPLNPDALNIDNWRFTVERSQSTNRLRIVEITAPQGKSLLTPPQPWGGFGIKISPFQLVEVRRETQKTGLKRGNFCLEIEMPQVMITGIIMRTEWKLAGVWGEGWRREYKEV